MPFNYLPTIFPLNQVYDHDYAIKMVNSWFGLGFVGDSNPGTPEKKKQSLSQRDPQESNRRPRNHQPLADNDILIHDDVQNNNNFYYI